MNILFVFAHPDDEAYGPAGTIAKYVKLGHSVWIASLCQGNRPGADVTDARQEAFEEVCAKLGATGLLGNGNDVHLDFHEAVAQIETYVKRFEIDVVYTHNTGDLHRDHRTTAEAALVVCRPRPGSRVSYFYMCEQGPDMSFGTIGQQFTPNSFVDVTEYIELKRTVMSMYETEVYPYPDARSVEAMEAMAMRRGAQIGAAFAEAFQLVFAHDRIDWAQGRIV